MSREPKNETDEQSGQPAYTNKLFCLLFVMFLAFVSYRSLHAGLAIFVFILFVVGLWIVASLIVGVTERTIPRSAFAHTKETLTQVLHATFFFGGCAMIGEILQGDNPVSEFVSAKMPIGVSISFIVSGFAIICVAALWAHTFYRLLR